MRQLARFWNKAIYIAYITKLYTNTQLAQPGGSGQACTLSSCLSISDECRGGVRQRALSVFKACWERPYSHLPHSRIHMHQNPLHFKTTFPFSLLRYYRLGREGSFTVVWWSVSSCLPLLGMVTSAEALRDALAQSIVDTLRVSDRHKAWKHWRRALLNHVIHVTAMMGNIQI